MSWQVEVVHFSTGEEVVFLNVLFWTNFPLYCCVSFASAPASHVLGGKHGQVSFSVPQGWGRTWRARTGLPAETTTAGTSGVTGSGSSSVLSPRRDSCLWLVFYLLGRSSPRASTACLLASQAHQLGERSWKCLVAQHGVGLLLLQQPPWETLSCCLQAWEQGMKNPKRCQRNGSEVAGRGPTQTGPIKTGARGTMYCWGGDGTETQGTWVPNWGGEG